jgi:hypothetical protein
MYASLSVTVMTACQHAFGDAHFFFFENQQSAMMKTQQNRRTTHCIIDSSSMINREEQPKQAHVNHFFKNKAPSRL